MLVNDKERLGNTWNTELKIGIVDHTSVIKTSRSCKRKLNTFTFDDGANFGSIDVSNIKSLNARKASRILKLSSNNSKPNDKVFKLNKREELISQMDGVFQKSIPAEDFIIGFRKIRDYLEESEPDARRRRLLLCSICTLVLADPSYRLNDCKPLQESYMGCINVDIDLFTAKIRVECNLPNMDMDENSYLAFWFDKLINNVIIDESLLIHATKFNINTLKKVNTIFVLLRCNVK